MLRFVIMMTLNEDTYTYRIENSMGLKTRQMSLLYFYSFIHSFIQEFL